MYSRWTRLLLVIAMVKCAVIGCRSGYAPTKTERKLQHAEQLRKNISVFAFPKRERQDVRDAWLCAVGRAVCSDWNPDHSGVCELHFRRDDFMDETFRKTQRQRKTLKPFAVPSLFNDHQR